jgi:hypothetical protein
LTTGTSHGGSLPAATAVPPSNPSSYALLKRTGEKHFHIGLEQLADCEDLFASLASGTVSRRSAVLVGRT